MASKKTTDRPQPLKPLEEHAAALPAWELAALRQATGWVHGKQITEAEYEAALATFRTRPQGGGRI